ncbi:MAG TPA: FIST N-terminal domain-containing protein [Rhodocyclaceae bacterium]|nr:FIST N-terminal domain-containing protein [Rhodocyclaceae bacterium]
MKLGIYTYQRSSGWDQPLDGGLDSPQTLLILFGASDHEALAEGMESLRRTFAQAQWLGCSTAGEVLDKVLHDDSLVVAVARFERVAIRSAVAAIEGAEDSLAAGRRLAEQLDGPDLQAVLVLADGLHINGSDLVMGLQGRLPKGVAVLGGLAADGDRFRRTWVLVNKAPSERHIAAVGLYGTHVGIHFGFCGGWDRVGPERLVTRARGNVLYQLDESPALDIYKRDLGERAAGLPATGLLFPLAICNGNRADQPTVRTLLGVSEAEGSITFAGTIPEGARVQLMYGNFERLVDAAAAAAESCLPVPDDGRPVLSVAITCVGRRLVLGERAEEEIETMLDILPPGTRQVGYYSYGEISPQADGSCHLHNQTMTVTVLWEA